MRVLMIGLALAVLVARPAGAGRMLYATAASPNRVDGFCLQQNGAIIPERRVTVGTGFQPRRLLVVGSVLYVAEAEQVEAFQIEPRGRLRRLGETPVRSRSGPRDVAVNVGGTMLYVPDRSRNRIVGHPLNADGSPQADFTTCIQGELGESYQNLLVTADRLYVSSSGGSGRIQVFGITPDGNLFGATDTPTPSDCTSAQPGAPRPDATLPLSERRKIADVKSFVLNGTLLYAEDRGRRRIRAFQLQPDGNFPPPTIENPEKPNRKTWPPAVSKTRRVAQYQLILMHNRALLATQFFRGRVDSYELQGDDLLPKRPARISNADLRFTPVRATADQDVMYVAAGEYDRVLAYRLHPNGVLRDKDPFSESQEQEGSFPNDVAVAMLAEGCP